MTNRKNYNSILFLTVYLGLVLVGGSSHVFAHAATNSLFDIRNEIEFKDDLDNKPDDEIKYFTETFAEYLSEVEKFSKDLESLHLQKKFNINSEKFSVERFYLEQCKFDSNIQISVKDFGKIENPALFVKITEIRENLLSKYANFSDCFPSSGFDNNGAKNSQIKLDFNQENLAIQLSFLKHSPQKAKLFAEQSNQALAVFKVNEDEKITKIIYENTKVLSSNNQVFIVTRLPRGSIDSLLK